MVLTQERDLGISLQVQYFIPWVGVMEFWKKGKEFMWENNSENIFVLI